MVTTICLIGMLSTTLYQEAVIAPRPQVQAAQSKVRTDGPITLQEMTESADRIFQGKVTKVANEQMELDAKGGKKAKIDVRAVTFDVTKAIKGEGIKEGQPYTVRLFASTAQPIKVGDEVIWYLAKAGKSGLTAPLGVYSGHFKVEADPQHPDAKVALNLANNRGLWSSKTSLIDSSSLKKQGFEEKVQAMAGDQARKNRVLAAAARPSRPGPVPVELITATSESLLETPH